MWKVVWRVQMHCPWLLGWFGLQLKKISKTLLSWNIDGWDSGISLSSYNHLNIPELDNTVLYCRTLTRVSTNHSQAYQTLPTHLFRQVYDVKSPAWSNFISKNHCLSLLGRGPNKCCCLRMQCLMPRTCLGSMPPTESRQGIQHWIINLYFSHRYRHQWLISLLSPDPSGLPTRSSWLWPETMWMLANQF